MPKSVRKMLESMALTEPMLRLGMRAVRAMRSGREARESCAKRDIVIKEMQRELEY